MKTVHMHRWPLIILTMRCCQICSWRRVVIAIHPIQPQLSMTRNLLATVSTTLHGKKAHFCQSASYASNSQQVFGDAWNSSLLVVIDLVDCSIPTPNLYFENSHIHHHLYSNNWYTHRVILRRSNSGCLVAILGFLLVYHAVSWSTRLHGLTGSIHVGLHEVNANIRRQMKMAMVLYGRASECHYYCIRSMNHWAFPHYFLVVWPSFLFSLFKTVLIS